VTQRSKQLRRRFSAGCGGLERSDETIADWLNRADHALYSAKASGRNRVAAAASDLLDRPLSRRQQLTNDR
jgi:PleD family two-component response regulator